MALEVAYWKRDGNGEAQLRATRIKRIAEATTLAEAQNRPVGCVRVTLERTDKQGSNMIRSLWVKPGYVSPF